MCQILGLMTVKNSHRNRPLKATVASARRDQCRVVIRRPTCQIAKAMASRANGCRLSRVWIATEMAIIAAQSRPGLGRSRTLVINHRPNQASAMAGLEQSSLGASRTPTGQMA